MKRTVLITGGGKGIGAATAEAFAAAGFNVIVAYNRSKAAAEALANKLAAVTRAAALYCDVANRESVDALYTACKAFGRVDTLVNNAGVSLYKLFQHTSDADYDAVMQVNCRGAFTVTRAFLPDMIDARFGRIVNVSSMWGVVGASMETVYSMSKAALIGLTKALAKETAPSGVTVNAVAPGAIDTDMMKGFSAEERQTVAEETPLGRLGTPEDVAKSIVYLADENSFVTGSVLHINGGYLI